MGVRHQHDHDHHGRGAECRGEAGGRKLLVVILFNAIITAAEYVGGVLSGSLALISDAGHNLADVLSLILGYAGERLSQGAPSRRYTFGLKRFEVLAALVNALSLVAIGLYIVYEAVERYMNPVPVKPSIMLPVALIGLAGNVFSILILNRSRNDSLNMRAAFLHLFYDAISSVAVIAVGVALIFTKLVLLDLAVSLVIAVMIVWSSMDIVRESLRIFLQGAPAGIDTDAVYQGLLAVSGVAEVHGLHIWSISSSEIFLSCHLRSVEGGAGDTDAVIAAANAMLERDFGITHTAIQVERALLCGKAGENCCR
ncbi:MAG: Cadmium, cobalt and zinc/H(+)-K(+) antiporter [Spirochaetes bacterium ADurb.BinA120]|jgi:cobalt-zinc-cadmium efflux system protein|nr:MAG: Cadmium, cobalt and zinc/H(+)-K(+) antiporter [Spirochaetes bacterium ADurb.BinA120]